MKAIVNTGPDRLELLDLPTPEPAAGQVRVRSRAVGICTTDLKMISGWKRTPFPAVPGHEWSGVIDSVGPGVDPKLIGRLCVAENILEDGGEVGFEHPGGYAQYFITLARNIHPLPDHFPMHLAALVEPLAVCVHGLARLRIDSNSPILIHGDGPIGLLFLSLLKQRGFQNVDLSGRVDFRLAAARSLGAQKVFHSSELPANQDSAGQRDFLYPFQIEASGSADALAWAVDHSSNGGRILVLGDYSERRAGFLWNDLLHKELEIIGSNASSGGWPEAVQLAVSGSLPLDRLVTHLFPYQRFQEALETAARHRDRCLKVMLSWD